nr:unnamed protein product [Spirometra erinaceieuropaei]
MTDLSREKQSSQGVSVLKIQKLLLVNMAFRWIRAITNAASANAFISQNMESSGNLESDPSVQPDNAFSNPNKLFSRPHFQPFIMQKLLQQQHLAKFGYLADSALNLLQWRNFQNMMTGYSPMPEFQQFSNSHCTAYGPANGPAVCTSPGPVCTNPQDYRQQLQQEEGHQSLGG